MGCPLVLEVDEPADRPLATYSWMIKAFEKLDDKDMHKLLSRSEILAEETGKLLGHLQFYRDYCSLLMRTYGESYSLKILEWMGNPLEKLNKDIIATALKRSTTPTKNALE